VIKDNLSWMYLLSGQFFLFLFFSLSSPLSTKIRHQMTESTGTMVLQIVVVALIQHSVGARG
jgi:hypothetical protein